MHFPAIATGFCLLAKYFTKSPIPLSSVSSTPTVLSTNSIADITVKSAEGVSKAVESVEEVGTKPVKDVSKSVEKQAINTIERNASPFDERSGFERIESTRRSSILSFEASQSRTDSREMEVECAPNRGVLQARTKKDLELVAAKNPILRSITQRIELGEADELMNKVLKMFEEIEEMEKFRLQLQALRATFHEDLGDGVQARVDPIPLENWIDMIKEVEIALDIVRCEMTVEDVDDLLTRLYIEMNRLAAVYAKSKEDRKRIALKVSAKIKEYAEVLLESPCEVRLAVERARVRSVVAKCFTPSDAEYLALLSPGSSHIPSCDRSCVLSYLPYRVLERSEVGSEPDLILNEGSRCSTPSEVPNTPRVSISELQEDPGIMPMAEEPIGMNMRRLDVVVVKSKRIERRETAKVGQVRKMAKVTGGGKPAWRF
ncbi:hypothetical protein RhiXN_09550 [Rhizoctonia solani]|uniref:Uncharacterized protein n=1 Tax=Rhizoctonia solani TaxID=456999 RepID=A0A8H8NZV0_9AGAM|nr:uncharacterized protein RhiXN_09550 [Rhizoctonia solani]QRW21963.1 hypothetical protein RhiXN_09550 [Rhizoctonia solani]